VAESEQASSDSKPAACPRCARLRSALRAARKRIQRLVEENRTLKEELLSAGEMIEDLAQEMEKPLGH
jgi:hypothetical protein